MLICCNCKFAFVQLYHLSFSGAAISAARCLVVLLICRTQRVKRFLLLPHF